MLNLKDYPNIIEPGLRANSEFNKFFYRFKVGKKEFRKVIDYSKKASTKADNKKNAKAVFLADKQACENNVDFNSTINDIVNLYLETLPNAKYKKIRLSYYERKVKSVLGSRKAKDILPHHIQTLVNENISKGDKPATAKQALEILSAAFNIAILNKIVTYNPCLGVKIKIPTSKKIVTNATERLSAIYNAIVKLYSDDPFYKAFFLLALQGRRKGEILNLKWEHVSFEYDYYFLADTKNGEEQKIFLPPNVKDALLKFQKHKGWIFESPVIPGQKINGLKRQVSKLKREVGDWFGLHYCRNIMVSAMAERGVDSIMMSGALGHNDPNTITKYLTMNYLQGSKIASAMIQGE